MTQITLRGLDPSLETEIRKIAKTSGKSLNQVVQDMIKGSAPSERNPAAHSLGELAGGWSDADAREFFETIRCCEQIDEEMWR